MADNQLKNIIYLTENYSKNPRRYQADAAGFAKIKDIVYDVDSNQFRDVSIGQPFTDSDFAELAKSDRARQVNAGSTTLKRAAIASTLLREQEGKSRYKLLEGISQLSLQSALLGSQLENIFYQSRDKARGQISFGNDITQGINAPNIFSRYNASNSKEKATPTAICSYL